MAELTDEMRAAGMSEHDIDVDTMRDVYMLPSQRAAYERILARLRAAEADARALLSAGKKAREALSELIATGDRKVFADALRALDAAIDAAMAKEGR